MENKEGLVYEYCYECIHAEFLDYKTLKCSKNVLVDLDSDCDLFEDVHDEIKSKGQNEQLLEVADEIEDILDREEEMVVEKLEQAKPAEIVLIEEVGEQDDFGRNSEVIRFCINTKAACPVYSSPETKPNQILRTEAPNTLIEYNRKVIRKGQNFFLIKEENGSKAYIKDDPAKVHECTTVRVKDYSKDILLIAHDTYDQLVGSPIVRKRELKEKFADRVQSSIEKSGGITQIKLKNSLKIEGKTKIFLESISLNKEVNDLQIGRILPSSHFYLLEDKPGQSARKIKLADETEAIFLSPPDSCEEIQTKLEKFVGFVSMLLFAAVFLIGILVVLSETGWVVVLGILVFPLAIIIKIFFSLPLYVLLSQIIRRF